MNGISHKQAIKWIDRRLDGQLDERQRLSLEEHLRSCNVCRAYATEMDLLPTRIQNEFHLRWDDDPGPSNDFNPFWSPDGKRIAFEGDRTGSTQIFLIDADESNVTQLTDGEVDHRFENPNPWSPDSKHIAFVIVEPQENRDKASIYIVNTEGNNLTNVTKLLPVDEELGYWNYTLFRERKSITFIAGRYAGGNDNGRYAVYEAGLDGNTLNEVATYSARIPPDWWNGTASVQGFDDGIPASLTWLRSDGTALKQLFDTPISAKPGSRPPIDNISLSSDGCSIAFNVASSDKTEIYVLNVNEALQDSSIQPDKYVVGGAGFISYNISWQPVINNDVLEEKPTPEPETQTDNSPNLVIDSYSCKPYSDIYNIDSTFRPPGQLYNYKLIQGTSLSDGDFLFEFWLFRITR